MENKILFEYQNKYLKLLISTYPNSKVAFLTQDHRDKSILKDTLAFKKISQLLADYDFSPPQAGAINHYGPQTNYIFHRHDDCNIPYPLKKTVFVKENFEKDFFSMLENLDMTLKSVE
ncbi:MAG: hypothetical protein RRY12_01660 [Cloacibacillus sp.]